MKSKQLLFRKRKESDKVVCYKEWVNAVRGVSPLGSCLVYKRTKLETALAKILPHIIPFISKRRRVAIRNYWKYRHSRRACTALCKLLMNQEYKPFHAMPDFTGELYEWEVIEKGDTE